MTDDPLLRREIVSIMEMTADASDAPAGWWEGEAGAVVAADRRRVLDDLRAGRLHWREARDHAERALAALDAGDLALAEIGLRSAKALVAIALARQVGATGIAVLNGAASSRGRSALASRDRRFADAVAAQEAKGVFGKAARAAALRADPALAAEFDPGIGDAALRAALRRAEKL